MKKLIITLLCFKICTYHANASKGELSEHFPESVAKIMQVPDHVAKKMGQTSPTLEDCKNYANEKIETDKFIIFGHEAFFLGGGAEGKVWLAADKQTGEWLAAKTFNGSLKVCEQHPSYKSLLKLNRLKGAFEESDNLTYILSTLVDGVGFNKSYWIHPQKTDEERVLICLNYLKEQQFLAKNGMCMTDLNQGENIMINHQGHVFTIDFGHTAFYAEPSDHFMIDYGHLSLLRNVWLSESPTLGKFITDNNKDEITNRPYGKFIMNIFEQEGIENERWRTKVKDGYDLLVLLQDLMSKHNHPKKIIYSKK